MYCRRRNPQLRRQTKNNAAAPFIDFFRYPPILLFLIFYGCFHPGQSG
ncbi:MAG: hypothetical protein JWQ21_2373 [Herminiimonas sp.]|nr:hypothetical protein [Herminiimonas sp.]